MKGILCCLFDGKAESFGIPEFHPNKATALRSFEMAVNSEGKSVLQQFPQDFTLFVVAEVDNGVITPVDKLSLANGMELKKAQ